MGVQTTVVFADLTGSTGVFESLGNAKATEAITRITQWIGQVCEAHHGRVVKMLGDGVLAVFPEAANAVEAMIEAQQNHQKRIQNWPDNVRMQLQIGVAAGEIVVVDGDCYGDAVNVASRISDMAGPGAIWANDEVIDQISHTGIRYRGLGPINIRGKAEPIPLYRVDWEEETSEFLTVQSSLSSMQMPPDPSISSLEIGWLDQKKIFAHLELPITLGRVAECNFVVNDPRVSRTHSRIEWRHGSMVLVDVSSYGTWVRFTSGEGGATELALRREECTLHGSGEIGLGAPFTDFSAPIVTFTVTQAARAISKSSGPVAPKPGSLAAR